MRELGRSPPPAVGPWNRATLGNMSFPVLLAPAPVARCSQNPGREESPGQEHGARDTHMRTARVSEGPGMSRPASLPQLCWLFSKSRVVLEFPNPENVDENTQLQRRKGQPMLTLGDSD